MKTPKIFPAILFATALSMPFGAYAAGEKDAAIEAPAKGVKPHSHMEEKTGVAPKTTQAPAGEKSGASLKADKDKSKHFHPRDGK